MITIYEITGNPCRDIIEGRTERRILRTVPYVEFTATAAQPSKAPDLCRAERPRSTRTTADVLELFRKTEPGHFTTNDCAEFARTLGQDWHAGSFFWALKHSTAKRTGKSGQSHIYQFPE
jgi:hypothetical protein